jgi:outer membrane protein OmpA-like peptidoglycan-associated protein
MKRIASLVLSLLLLILTAAAAPSQFQSGTGQGAPASEVVSKSTKAIGYQTGGGSTKVDLKGTQLMPQAIGEAKVEAKKGATNIEAEIKSLGQATKFGAEFLTYVLWAVSTEGRTSNLGEVLTDKDGKGKLKVSTQMSVFSLIVTAEPYYAVRQPSELVVLENDMRKDTKGKLFVINDYKLMKRGQYQKKANPLALTLDLKNVPLEMYEARNAVEVAKSNGVEKYSQEIFTKAEASLKMAENALVRKAEKKEIIYTARQAVQFSEDARALASQRQEEERIAQEREAAAAKAKAEAEAKAAAEAAAVKQRADAEASRQAELAAAKEALLKLEAQRQAELAAAREAQIKAEADASATSARAAADAAAAKAKAEAEASAASAKAEADALKAKEAAAQAEIENARKDAEALRAKLLQQFSQVLDTRDTERGLVVNMSDVLFDSGKFTLRSEAREKLARIAGIVLNYPKLKLEAEGHTDNVGSEELNQKLSEQRSDSVRQYMLTQGIAESSITSVGRGFSVPVAPNETAAGRQKNRRVELIVSGEVIGKAIGSVKK